MKPDDPEMRAIGDWSRLTPEHVSILEALPCGRENAERSDQIAARLDLPRERTDVYFRSRVRELRLAGFPVCSSSHKPAGFWWPENAAEIDETRAHMLSRLRALALVESAMNDAAGKMFPPDTQGDLFD